MPLGCVDAHWGSRSIHTCEHDVPSKKQSVIAPPGPLTRVGRCRPKRRNAWNCSTGPTHDFGFGAKRCHRFLVVLSGGSKCDSPHPKGLHKVGGPAHRVRPPHGLISDSEDSDCNFVYLDLDRSTDLGMSQQLNHFSFRSPVLWHESHNDAPLVSISIKDLASGHTGSVRGSRCNDAQDSSRPRIQLGLG